MARRASEASSDIYAVPPELTLTMSGTFSTAYVARLTRTDKHNISIYIVDVQRMQTLQTLLIGFALLAFDFADLPHGPISGDPKRVQVFIRYQTHIRLRALRCRRQLVRSLQH